MVSFSPVHTVSPTPSGSASGVPSGCWTWPHTGHEPTPEQSDRHNRRLHRNRCRCRRCSSRPADFGRAVRSLGARIATLTAWTTRRTTCHDEHEANRKGLGSCACGLLQVGGRRADYSVWNWVQAKKADPSSFGLGEVCLCCVLGYRGFFSCQQRASGVRMGIISFIKGGTQQLAIARPDSAKDYWVYKHAGPEHPEPCAADRRLGRGRAVLQGRQVRRQPRRRSPHAGRRVDPVLGPAGRQDDGRQRLHLRSVLCHHARAARDQVRHLDRRRPGSADPAARAADGLRRVLREGDRSAEVRDRHRRPARDRQRRVPRLVQEPSSKRR